jgi:hypothetical protein
MFVRGTDNSVWHNWSEAGVAGAWEPLGGIGISNPSAGSMGPGRVTVVIGGSDNATWFRSWDGARWSGWQRLAQTNGQG